VVAGLDRRPQAPGRRGDRIRSGDADRIKPLRARQILDELPQRLPAQKSSSE
jgi:hypothetical protein